MHKERCYSYKKGYKRRRGKCLDDSVVFRVTFNCDRFDGSRNFCSIIPLYKFKVISFMYD